MTYERSNWRDQQISKRHRAWGMNCPAVDLDFVLLEFNHGVPVAVVDYKHSAKPDPLADLNEWAIKAMSALYNEHGENLPFFVARYWPDSWAFKVKAMNNTALDQLRRDDWVPMTEQQWVRGLHLMRKKVLAVGDLKQIERLKKEMPPPESSAALPIRQPRRQDKLSAVVQRGRRILQPCQSTSNPAGSKRPMGDRRLMVQPEPDRRFRAIPCPPFTRRHPNAGGDASRYGAVEKTQRRLRLPRLDQVQPDAKGSPGDAR